MLAGVAFWGTIIIFATFYFGATVSGLELAAQFEAARANRLARLLILLPSLVMFLRDALRLLRR
ncbi:MAG TPA: hypothetical protein VFH48_21485 [Chloroflexota bacterium]|nr:hypothetical protein [Chloroflexota bacterium]